MSVEWQRKIEVTACSQEIHDRLDRIRDKYLEIERAKRMEVPAVAVAVSDLMDLEGSTDESIDILVDAKPIPVSAEGGCCGGGRCHPKPEPKTMVFQAACEDSSQTYRQTTHFEKLDSLPFRAGLLCEQAAKIVGGARMGAYGKPEDNFERIAILDDALDACLATVPHGHVNGKVKVALRNIMQKVARIVATPNHTDSWRDIAGYADCGARCAGCDPAS